VIGQSVGPFRVLEKLGAGGMGEVYLAEDTRLGRKVALKRPAESWLRDPDARARLQREARAAARLNNPGIAAVYDVLDLEDRPYIVMEYVEGDTLATHLRRGAMPLERALALGIDIADALAAAHAGGVIHRDLKPGNIVLTAAGAVKILDFGLAKTLKGRREDDSAALLTHPGQVLGTPGYVAPEQLLGRPADARCDIYSVGAILYEMLTGRAPYQQPDSMSRALASLVEPVPSAHTVNPSIPLGVSAVVDRAMAREPDARYKTAAELRLVLEQVASSLGDTPTRLLGTPEPKMRRLRESLQVLAAVVLLLAVAGVPLSRWWKTRTPGAEAAIAATVPVIAVLPFDNLSGDSSLDYLGAGMAETMSTLVASLSNVSVIPRAQIHDALRGTKDVSKVAAALGASYVVTGGVQKVGSRMQVTMNMLRPDGRFIVSAGVFEDDYANLFGIQRRLAEALSAKLVGAVSASEREQLARRPTESLDALSTYWQGRALVDQPSRAGALDNAIARFRQASALDPKFALAHAGLGDALWVKYRETKNPEDAKAAIAAIEKARALDPSEPMVRLALAQTYQATGRIDDAVRELEAMIQMQPNNDDARRLLGTLYVGQGKNEEAVAQHERAIGIRPNYWRNRLALGAFYYRTGRFAEAAVEFRRVTELQPESSWSFLNLGSAYHAAGDLQRAIDNYKRAIELSPTDYVAYSNLGALYHTQGRFREAVEAYTAAIKVAPANPVLHRNVADTLRKKGEDAAARKAYERAIVLANRMLAVNPKDASTVSLVALCQAKLSRFDQAREAAARAVALAPKNGEVLHRAAATEALAGNHAAALALCERAIAHGASRTLIREDEDFDALRRDPQFIRLTVESRER
jgi:serine/threonine protein kinase/Flp pilus assembly protein TadD